MPTSTTTTVMSVRVNGHERNLLTLAAEQARSNLSDFVRRKALAAAEADLLDHGVVTIAAADWEKFESWAGAPAKNVPALRRLAAGDDRARFDCGEETLNLWFRCHAWANQQSSVSRTNVLCDRETGGASAL